MRDFVREEVQCINTSTCPACCQTDLLYVNPAKWVIIKCRHSKDGCTYHQHAAITSQSLQGVEQKERVAIFNRLRQHENVRCKYRVSAMSHAQVSTLVLSAVAMEASVAVTTVAENSVASYSTTSSLILPNNPDRGGDALNSMLQELRIPSQADHRVIQPAAGDPKADDPMSCSDHLMNNSIYLLAGCQVAVNSEDTSLFQNAQQKDVIKVSQVVQMETESAPRPELDKVHMDSAQVLSNVDRADQLDQLEKDLTILSKKYSKLETDKSIVESELRQLRISCAKDRQQRLLLRWRRKMPKLLRYFEQQHEMANAAPSLQRIIQEENKAYDVLATSELGTLIAPCSGLGQKRRSARAQSQRGLQVEHQQLIQKILACGHNSRLRHKGAA
jgi:hypothetical protein